MRFPPSLLDEIRARLPASQVIGRRVKLKRQGREFAGLSPFKQEKTPSFTVNDQKGFYHCFATGEHGDIFKFLMKVEGLSFPEAVEQLAGEAGVEMPKSTPQAEAREELVVRLRKITAASGAYFQKMLASPEGRDARAYLDRRGLGREDIERFRLGYAPQGRHQLKEHLAAQGFAPDDMAASGMLIAGDDIPVSYDRFRNRLIFPITDPRGEVIAFGGRALAAEQQPKYLNSPETPLFHKGSVLFNAAIARQAAHTDGGVIVAEGYMDVIALARAGFANAVAPLGTALTPDQIKLLWRMADEPLLCFDGDAAGIKAAHRAVETALPLLTPGKSLAFAFLPDGLDPDDLLRQQGPEGVAAALRTPKPLVEVLWAKEFSAEQWTTPERRARFETRLNELIETIADKTVRQYYAQEVRRRLRDQFSGYGQQPRRDFSAGGQGKGPQRGANRFGAKPGQSSRQSGGFTGSKRGGYQPFVDQSATASLAESAMIRATDSSLPHREALIVTTLLNHPWLLDDYSEEVAAIQFEADALQTLRDCILSVHTEQNPLDKDTLSHQLGKLGHSRLLARVEHAITHNSDWNTQPHASHESVLIGWRHRLALHRKAVELKRELESAGRAYEIDQSEENYLRLQDLSRQVWSTEGVEIAASDYGKSEDG
ncbi:MULTISPECIES: DNA primase [Rhodomicrobium]|uniref:DNA primase n=1 Tax=Rhodomicrobium TaxID=1068 RepID=UPI000B4B653F|nr:MULTISPECIES: DNA primase [Rhodomicrobium]